MDRIAIISDIHGNLEALKAVFNDIEKRDIKRIFCLGDIVSKGVNSSECLELIRSKCEVVIKGNNDEFIANEHNFTDEPKYYKELHDWNRSFLTEEQLTYLKNLPFCYEFYMSGSLVRLFHASPTLIYDFVGDLDSIENKRKLFMPSENTISKEMADIVIYGHIHIQCSDNLYNRIRINVGSVGNALDYIRNKKYDANVKQTTRANYVIIEGEYGKKDKVGSFSYQFVKLPYNIDKELETEKYNFERASYIHELKEGQYRDLERVKKSFQARHIDMNEF